MSTLIRPAILKMCHCGTHGTIKFSDGSESPAIRSVCEGNRIISEAFEKDLITNHEASMLRSQLEQRLPSSLDQVLIMMSIHDIEGMFRDECEQAEHIHSLLDNTGLEDFAPIRFQVQEQLLN